jgi:hypothetical protein
MRFIELTITRMTTACFVFSNLLCVCVQRNLQKRLENLQICAVS